MAKLSLGQKVQRVLTFLFALRRRRIAAALMAHGFGQEDLDEGWRLLRAVSGQRLAGGPPASVDSDLLLALDAFENKWFPIVALTLSRHFPDVHAAFFRNLSQTEGAEVLVSVGTFVERFDALGGEADPRGAEARALLERRGLTEPVLTGVRALLERASTISPAEPAEPEAASVEEAEAALWAWYLEWGGIARIAVRSRSDLRALGFLASSSSPQASEEDGEAEPEEATEEPIAPADDEDSEDDDE